MNETQFPLWEPEEAALREFHANWEAYMLQQEQAEFYWTVNDPARDEWFEYLHTTREEEDVSQQHDSVEVLEA